MLSIYPPQGSAIGDISGLGTGVETFLATPSSANLAAAVTDESGSGALVFANTPTLTAPRINSHLGLDTAAITTVGIHMPSVLLSGATSQYGQYNGVTFGSDCTVAGYGHFTLLSTTAAAYTLPSLRSYNANGFSLGAGSAVTNYYGFYSGDETNASNHYAFTGAQSATNASDRNCYMTGAAPNYFNGAVMIGSNTDDGVNLLQVNGGAVSKHATAGIGYATGAGGTVTQATNKATGVTLNKVTGDITMNNAALAAGVIVSFVMTNSAIAATDFLDVQHVSAGTLGAYTAQATCAAGSATIYVRNNTAGSLSEAIVLKFYLNKAVTS